MNPLGKEQDKIFEHLEKGNFIAPPGGDPRDERDIPRLRRAAPLLAAGVLLTSLLPGVFDGWELASFLGALLIVPGAARIWEQSRWVKAALFGAVVQLLALALRLVAQTTVPALLDSTVYSAAGYASTALGAVIPWLLALGLGNCCRRCALCMAVAALAATVLVFLQGLLTLCVVLAVLGTAALVCLVLVTPKEIG